MSYFSFLSVIQLQLSPPNFNLLFSSCTHLILEIVNENPQRQLLVYDTQTKKKNKAKALLRASYLIEIRAKHFLTSKNLIVIVAVRSHLPLELFPEQRQYCLAPWRWPRRCHFKRFSALLAPDSLICHH
ncbi:hypothetical protein CEXT_306331 [Caerostris extrusa]|uniref:Uncharacterized protein n=1 Tax=Caerostris extrusa TaxID=172846 RepID=A0AAV4NEM6_CAEEX|nr:hypothetical protein CEXT_306331 [Caerostris extrusa]